MGSKEVIPVNKVTEKMLPPHLRRKSKGSSYSSSSLNLTNYDYFVAGDSISIGNAVHLAADGFAYKADADNNKPALAFAMNDAEINETVYITTNGQCDTSN